MADIFDYLDWRGDIPMEAVGFGDADMIVLTSLSYIDFPSGTRETLGKLCADALRKLDIGDGKENRRQMLHHKEDEPLMRALTESVRFRSLPVDGCEQYFDEDTETQFGAMTVYLPDGTAACVFRGTDWSLIGWKEDINMAYCDATPGQMLAVRYLRELSNRFLGKIRVMGHSKGGNAAIFAAAFSGLPSERIINVTSLDGPGFSEAVFRSDEYRAIQDKTRTIMPRSSIVGSLFLSTGRFTIIEADAAGLMQHIPYNWEVMGAGFVTAATRDSTSQLVGNAINDWIASMEPEARRHFIDTLWRVFEGTDITDLGDLLDGKNTLAMLRAYSSMDEESKKMVSEVLAKLRACTRSSLRELIQHYRDRK